MKFVRKTASEKSVNIVSVADRRRAEDVEYSVADVESAVEADRCAGSVEDGVDGDAQGRKPESSIRPEERMAPESLSECAERIADVDDGEGGEGVRNTVASPAGKPEMTNVKTKT